MSPVTPTDALAARALLALASLGVVAVTQSVACSSPDHFACQSDLQCSTDDAEGQCEPEGVCSFPDDACPSMRRYGEHSGQSSGQCVPLPEATGTGSGTTEAGSSSSSSSGPSAESTGTTTSGSSTGLGTSTGGSESTTGEKPPPYAPCDDAGACEEPGSECLMVGMGGSVCTTSCSMPSEPSMECPEPTEGTAIPACIDLDGIGMGLACALLCAADRDCPMGMGCQLTVLGNFCTWP